MTNKFGQLKDVPLQVLNKDCRKIYDRGMFLGKGGFARCYEFTDINSQEKFACKVVTKSLIVKLNFKEKLTQEIEIQRSLKHPHVVKIFNHFDDSDNIYILLELCPKKSLMELHKRRRVITEPEARYFTKQIVEACEYIHNKNIIHRDLKLGNLFLTEMMDIKIGDFGLATVIFSNDERKKTLCGTPNYIAPEILNKCGHSFEVDIWAIGCILYTLLVGKPPFEASTLKDTYNRIKSNNYMVPVSVSTDARSLIKYLLHSDPVKRPKIKDILNFNFFTSGFLPSRLPTSCLTMAPKFSYSPARQNKVLSEISDSSKNAPDKKFYQEKERDEWYLIDLKNQIHNLFSHRLPQVSMAEMDQAIHPASAPEIFVAKWVDYSDRYGLGYQLSDGSVGVLFNDSSKLLVDAPGEQLQYCDKKNNEFFFAVKNYPSYLEKKYTLLNHFRKYMREHLVHAVPTSSREGDELARLPILRTWFRTKAAIILHLTNGTLQMNFFADHVKLIVCPLMSAVSFIDSTKSLKTYKLNQLPTVGCEANILKKLQYTKHIVDRMLNPQQDRSNKVNYTALEAAHLPDVKSYGTRKISQE
uniref:Serine/threonine-protein kinase PLK n=1 Tax=Parastrongyloides trichosuri TaxID=131310 RepID=A0A0N4ZU17_PARTI